MWAVLLVSILSIFSQEITTQTLQISSSSLPVVENDALELTCSYDRPCEILLWYKNGVGIFSSIYSDGQCFTNTESVADSYTCEQQGSNCIFTLSWNNAQFDQNGDKWKCIVSGVESTEIEVKVTVPITSVTMTTPTESPVNVSEGVRTMFVCETSSGKPAATMQWYKRIGSGTPIEITNNVSTDRRDNSTLAASYSTLAFVPNRFDHNYLIYCSANNHGVQNTLTSSNKPLLIVSYPCDAPTIQNVANGSEYRIINGRTNTLTCTAIGGRPPATLSWDCFDGNETGSVSWTRSVTWTATGSQDGMTCTCRTSYIIDSWNRQAYVRLKVLYPPSPPLLTVNERTISRVVSVIEDGSVSIMCNSLGFPAPYYTWNPKGDSTIDGVLTLTNVQIDSHGTIFTCTATNTMNPSHGTQEDLTISNNFTLDVHFEPRNPRLRFGTENGIFITQPFSVVKGDNFSIHCEFTGNPEPSYQWTGQLGNLLEITSIQTDRGWVCVALNSLRTTGGGVSPRSGRVSTRCTVMYGPSVPEVTYNYNGSRAVAIQSELHILEGMSFSVICGGSDSKPTATYSWSGAFSSSSDILNISDIRKQNNNANLTCTATNVMGRTFGDREYGTNRTSFMLVVLYGSSIPHFTLNAQPNSQLTFDRDLNLTLSCRVDSNPGSTIIFERNNIILHSVSDAQEAVYSMSSVGCTDAGIYSCTAYNKYNGDSKPTTQKNVTIRSSPIAVEPANNQTFYIEVHGNILLNLTVCAYPLPSSFKWYKYDDITGFKNSTKGFTSNYLQYFLSIENVSQADFGIYQIIVENGFGTVLTHQFIIEAQGPPETPTTLKFDCVSFKHNSVLLTWLGGFNGGLEQTFYIQYRSISDKTWVTLKFKDTGETTIKTTLTGLSAGINYFVRVFAGNSIGNSSTSEPVQFATLGNPQRDSQKEFINGVVVGVVPVSVLVVIAVVLIIIQRQCDIIERCKNERQTNNTTNQFQDVANKKDDM